MKKYFIFILFTIRTLTFSQTTSLVIDNQNPGWLSNKISYGDQKSLVNLKVTGYINNDDLTFIGKLMGEYSLNGKLDLSDVEIVGATTSQNNILNNSKKLLKGSVSHLSLPQSLDSAYYACNGLSIDTLVYGGSATKYIMPTTFKYKKVKKIILREGVEHILENTFLNSTNDFCSITLPNTLKTIGKKAFQNCYKLANIELPNNIVYIGEYAFANDSVAFGDTLKLPKSLESLDFSSFSCGQVAHVVYPYNYLEYQYTIPNNQVVYIPQTTKSIKMVGETEVKRIIWHMEATTPPELSFSSWANTYIGNAKKSITVYVPKSSISTYKNNPVWSELTIIQEPIFANKIILNQDSIKIKKGNIEQLNAIVLPEDADDKNYTWSSSNSNVASVTHDGLVSGIFSGEAKIFVTLNADKDIIDSCIVTVFQPVSSVKINSSSAQLNVGETLLLRADINPNDADNKNVIWTSSDESIIKVDCEGNVSAIQSGDARIIATSEDNKDANDYCIIKVLQPLNGITLDKSSITMSSLGQTEQLNVNYVPENASNKEIKWTSSNESVCIVSNGTIVAVGYGTSVIIATSSDGGYLAICTVTVEDTTGIEGITNDKDSNVQYFDLAGRPLSSPGKGITIIKRKDGSKEKLLIK